MEYKCPHCGWVIKSPTIFEGKKPCLNCDGFVELQAAQPLRAVDAPKPCDNFRKARDGKCFNCGCEQSAHH